MRTAHVTINGKEYLTCFSTRVLMALEEHCGDADVGLRRIMEEHKIADIFWLLQQMIDAGYRYAMLEGIENPGTLSLDELIDSVGVDEYEGMFKAIAETTKSGSTPRVRIKSEKNGETTQDK